MRQATHQQGSGFRGQAHVSNPSARPARAQVVGSAAA
jgi:hypothetical protein